MSTLFIQQLVTGFSIGAIYALLAVGYALIYSIFKFTNFAFGAIMMCSAYGAYFVVKNLGMTSLAAGLCGAIIIGIIISIITELVAYRSLRRLKASRLFLMISAMGVNILLQNLMTIWMSANLRSLNISLPFRVLAVGKIKIGSIDILSLLVLSGLFLRLGLIARREGQIARAQTEKSVEVAQRLTKELPELFADDPQALGYVQEAIEKAISVLDQIAPGEGQ